MSPRFFYDEPRPASVADKLLENATSLELKMFKRDDGTVTTLIELHASVGAELFAEDDDGDTIDRKRESNEGLAFARQLLCGFAAAGSRGDA